MIKQRSNKIAIQSQHMIADSLFALMKRKSFQKISIAELCREAAIGRKTFYRNFDTKEDVIDFQLNSLFAMYKFELFNTPLEEQLLFHFSFIKDHAEFFVVLYQNGLIELANTKFSVLLSDTMPLWSKDPIEQEYRSGFIVAGIKAIGRIWISRGYSESVDAVVNIAKRTIG